MPSTNFTETCTENTKSFDSGLIQLCWSAIHVCIYICIFLIVLVPSSIYIVLIFIKHTYCFLTEVVVEKSSHCIVVFFHLQFFHMHQCTNMSINKLLLHIKSFMQDVFFLCLYCLTKCIVEYFTVHSWQVLYATNTFNSGIFNIFLLHYT